MKEIVAALKVAMAYDLRTKPGRRPRAPRGDHPQGRRPVQRHPHQRRPRLGDTARSWPGRAGPGRPRDAAPGEIPPPPSLSLSLPLPGASPRPAAADPPIMEPTRVHDPPGPFLPSARHAVDLHLVAAPRRQLALLRPRMTKVDEDRAVGPEVKGAHLISDVVRPGAQVSTTCTAC